MPYRSSRSGQAAESAPRRSRVAQTSSDHVASRLMQVCLDCGGTGSSPCATCGSAMIADVDGLGAITSLPPNSASCSECGATDQPLQFRRFRRVVGLFLADLIRQTAGYYCPACRHRLFWRWQGSTLLLGWWGLLAFIFRNPYAIAVNFRALVWPPGDAQAFGALNLEQIQSESGDTAG